MRRCATTLESELSPAELCYLLSLVRDSGFAGRHLEIGTAAGGTLRAMLACFDGATPPFVVVDPMTYFPDQLTIVRRSLRDHGLSPSAVEFRVATSVEAFPQAKAAGERFDFIFVDGCHKLKNVIRDIQWAELLSVDGLICFHDYTPRFPGVMWAVDRWLRRRPQYQVLGREGSLLAVSKTAAHRGPAVAASDLFLASLWNLPTELQRKWRRYCAKRQAA